MLCAIIDDNKVSDIKDLTEEQIQHLGGIHELILSIEGMDPAPKVGWSFDGQHLVNTDGSIPDMRITRLAMRQRFTVPEMIGLYAATVSNPMILILLDNLKASTFVDLTRSDTIAGIQYLVTQNLLTQERATQILTTPPAEIEKYREQK